MRITEVLRWLTTNDQAVNDEVRIGLDEMGECYLTLSRPGKSPDRILFLESVDL